MSRMIRPAGPLSVAPSVQQYRARQSLAVPQISGGVAFVPVIVRLCHWLFILSALIKKPLPVHLLRW